MTDGTALTYVVMLPCGSCLLEDTWTFGRLEDYAAQILRLSCAVKAHRLAARWPRAQAMAMWEPEGWQQ